jgi:hypothetical protein
MSRQQEYQDIMKELEMQPLGLEYVEQRVLAKARNRRIRSFFAVPVGSLLGLMAAFTLLVNVMPGVAQACEGIPLLEQLAQVVAFSPSMSEAVENEYVQPIELAQTGNGITVRVEYVIVDQKQLAIFYSLDSWEYDTLHGFPQILATDGSNLEGYSLSYGDYGKENGELRYLMVDFMDGDMPDSLQLVMKVQALDEESRTEEAFVEDSMLSEHEYEEPEYVCECDFILVFDADFTAQGETIQLNQAFELDGQMLILDTAEIYPTHMRINFKDVEDNTAWLKELSFYLENEQGERFGEIKNGITATGSPDSPMMASHRLESAFFSDSEKLTLHITGVTWLDKDQERIKLDLVKKQADQLPQGVEFLSTKQYEDGWILVFSAKEYEENSSYQIWGSRYYDEAGAEYSIDSWSSGSSGYWDEEIQEHIETPGAFCEEIPLKGYQEDTVYLSPQFSRKVELNVPVEISIK